MLCCSNGTQVHLDTPCEVLSLFMITEKSNARLTVALIMRNKRKCWEQQSNSEKEPLSAWLIVLGKEFRYSQVLVLDQDHVTGSMHLPVST